MLNQTTIKELNLGLDYVPNWGRWEAMRELMANAMDSAYSDQWGAEIDDDGNLVIWNRGKPLSIFSLILGESESRGSSHKIGQHGEGLKLALLVLHRLGHNVEIYSGRQVMRPITVERRVTVDKHLPDGEIMLNAYDDPVQEEQTREELAVEIVTRDENVAGTEIVISDWPEDEDFMHRFVFPGDERVLWEDEFAGRAIMVKAEENLFVKGIWADSRDPHQMVFSYVIDAELDRDRRIVSEWELTWELGKIWSQVDDPELWVRLLRALPHSPVEARADFNNFTFTGAAVEALRSAWHTVYPKGVVVETDDFAKIAKESGYQPVRANEVGNLKDVLQRELALFDDIARDQFFNEILETRLRKRQASNLEKARKIAFQVAEKLGRIPPQVIVGDLPDGNLGRFENGQIILSPQTLKDRRETRKTLIEEMAHAFFGTSDFQRNHQNAILEIADIMIEERIR